MANYTNPAIPLSEVQAQVLAGFWHIRREAQQDAIDFDPTISVRLCLLALTESDFHKSMDAEEPKWNGCRQDVYKIDFEGKAVYLKFQKWPLDKNSIFVVSFKEQ